VLAQQHLQRQLHRARDPPQQQDRDVAPAGLELREVALGDCARLGEAAARDVLRGAPGAHPLAQPGEIGGVLLGGGEGGVHAI
jgi:hypothetical protein